MQTPIKIIDLALNHRLIRKKEAVKLNNIIKYGMLTCELCKQPIKHTRNKNYKLSYDHIIPSSKGDRNEYNNLQYRTRRSNATGRFKVEGF